MTTATVLDATQYEERERRRQEEAEEKEEARRQKEMDEADLMFQMALSGDEAVSAHRSERAIWISHRVSIISSSSGVSTCFSIRSLSE